MGVLKVKEFMKSNDASHAPWWHLNTVPKIGGAINIVISVGLAFLGGGLAVSSIRALIAKVGAKKAQKNN